MLQAPEQGRIVHSPSGGDSGDLLERSVGPEARDDAALIAAARGGDDDAFRVLYRRYQHDARREALRRGAAPSAADDACSAAFASVFRAVASGGGPDTFVRPYLLKAVRNAVIDQSRRAKVRPSLEPLNDMEVADPKTMSVEAMGRRMTTALATLPQRQRLALWATEVEGRSATEMADELQLSSNGFAALKKRARHNLGLAYAAQITGGDTCTWVNAHSRRYVDGMLNKNDALLVELHVADCAVCASLLPERDRVRTPALLLPLLLAAPALRTSAPSSMWYSVSRRVHRLVAAARGIGALGVMAVPAGLVLLQLVSGADEPDVVRSALGHQSVPAETDDELALPLASDVESMSVASADAGDTPTPVAADEVVGGDAAIADTGEVLPLTGDDVTTAEASSQTPVVAPPAEGVPGSSSPSVVAPSTVPPAEVPTISAPTITVSPTTIPTTTTVPATTVPATTVPATTVPATTVPATTVPVQPGPVNTSPPNVAAPTTTVPLILTITATPTTNPPRSFRR